MSPALILALRDGQLPPAEGVAQLVDQAARHGVAPILLHRLSAQGAQLSPELSNGLRRASLQAAAVGMRAKRLLLSALDALAKEGITPVLLKGYGLGLRVYPDPLLRPTTDVDLLVSRAQVEAANRALAGLGLKPRHDSDDYYPEPYRQHFVWAGAPGMVELHFRPVSAHGTSWEADGPLLRSVPLVLEGRAARWLSGEDELVFLGLHAANHLLGRLGWLFDLRLLLERLPPLDWDRVARTAREEARAPAMLFYALEAARRTVGAPVPAAALEALAPSALRRFAARRFFSEDALVGSHLATSQLRRGVAKLALADSRLGVVTFALRRARWNLLKPRGVTTRPTS